MGVGVRKSHASTTPVEGIGTSSSQTRAAFETVWIEVPDSPLAAVEALQEVALVAQAKEIVAPEPILICHPQW